MTETRMCDECGETTGVVNHVTISWPGKEPFFLQRIDEEAEAVIVSVNPKANGRHVALWLHRDCEAAALKRLEQQKGAIE